MAEETASAKAKDESSQPNLTDILYGQLQIPEAQVNQVFTFAMLHEIIPALVRAGIMTRQQILEALDRAEREVAETCAEISPKYPDEHTTQISQRMSDRAKKVAGRIRDKLTVSS